MSTDNLEELLRDDVADLTLDSPVTGVIARGNKLRHRRVRGLTIGAIGALTVGVFGAAVMLPSGGNPIVTPAVASFSGGPTNLTPSELDQISDTCRAAYAEVGWETPTGTLPTVAEARDGTALAYFKVGNTSGDCTLDRMPDGTFRISSTGHGTLRPLPAGRHLVFDMLDSSDPGPIGGALADVAGVVRVSDDVASLTIEVAGRTLDGYVVDGFGLFWLPGNPSPKAVNHLTVTAYDDAGTVLERHSMDDHGNW